MKKTELEKFLVEKQTMTDNDIMIIKYPYGEIPMQTVGDIAKNIIKYMGNKMVMFLPKQLDVETIGKEQLKFLLENQLKRLQ
jgi:hypothetical protein